MNSSTNTITDIPTLEDRLSITNRTAAELRSQLRTATGQEAKDLVHGIAVLEAEARKIRRRLRHLRTAEQQTGLQAQASSRTPDLPTDPVQRRAWLDRMNELLYGREDEGDGSLP